MLKKLLLNFILIACISVYSFAQNTYSISGIVKDNKETLPGASVYISGYKIATSTNSEGQFSLTKLAPGNYDILVQMMGYLPYSKNIIISDKSVNIDIILTENATLLKEVLIKPDPNRAYYIALFKDFFLGKTPNANECTILNTNVLGINDDIQNSLLTIQASDFLIIENKALGYRIKYLLKNFEYNYRTKIIYYAGNSSFEELKGGRAKQNKWKKNREIAYNGSIQHFFKSLYSNTIKEEGFVINKLGTIPNPARKPDSLINTTIKRLISAQNGIAITFNSSDSLSYWMKQRNEPKEVNILNRGEVLVDTLVKPFSSDLKMMNYKDALYIIYKNEVETSSFNSSGFKQSRPPDIGSYQISVIDLLEPRILFYANGGIYDPRSLLYKGHMAYEKVADLVPMDYIPSSKK
ncbi:carboxypeptidase-like regulatory domain-containing protein [Pedobacter boryungensis]|uniref:Carboxypeptidase-like regulatory domain-containing protein n=1 Tax=Pedobacter boryungensis TaxID=869962 RepID=A0ABX2DEK2_9SPHI|nr:carboxypeptidase-like regulatory domain-containing protein [Pedobacter boryungensis]NQX32472.1 carboxypeptidase-like regulatory domain-containing protein [Pedobacter boryungensis]